MYIEKINAMFQALKQQTNVRILKASTFPPASPTQLQNVSRILPLSDDILAFYKETNGLQLLYVTETQKRESEEDYEDLIALGEQAITDWFYLTREDYPTFAGCLLIPPIEVLAKQAFYKDYGISKKAILEDHDPLLIGGEEIENAEEVLDTFRMINPCSRWGYYCCYTYDNQTYVTYTSDYGADLFVELEDSAGVPFQEFLLTKINAHTPS